MERSYQALLCAILQLAVFTLDSKGLSQGYRSANATSQTQPQQKAWFPQQQQQQQQLINQFVQQPSLYATSHTPSQQWNRTGGNFNQWSPYSQSQSTNKNWGSNNQTLNTYQRHNNTHGLQQQATSNWNVPQRPYQNPGHLYPHLPAVAPSRQPLQPAQIPSRYNNQWNQTRLPIQQYPGGVIGPSNQGSNWWANGQNRTWNVAPTTYPTYLRPTPSTGVQSNLWNQTKGNNNAGWITSTGALSNGSSASYPQGQVTWAGWGSNPAQQNPSGWGSLATGQTNPIGWSSPSVGQNNLPSNQQNNWQSSSNGLNNNNNWRGNGQSATGAQLAPLGGNSVISAGGGQPYGTSSGIPLAPLVSGAVAGTQPGWNTPGNSQSNPNAWNHGNSGSPQLAPLAPLSYGGGGGGGGSAAQPNRANGGSGSNPYATMFN